jgi:hypothetical protein
MAYRHMAHIKNFREKAYPKKPGKHGLKAESAAVDFDFKLQKPVIHIEMNCNEEFGVKCTNYF